MTRRFRALLLSSFVIASFVIPVGAADLSITAANVQMSAAAKKVVRTAGATITQGQTVYLDTTTNTELLADANAASPAYKVEGIAVTSALANQPVVVCTEDPKLKLGATVVVGDTIWQSATAGGLTKTAADNVTGMFVSVLGVAVSTSEINFHIIRSDVVKP